jgi:hypothetical protein
VVDVGDDTEVTDVFGAGHKRTVAEKRRNGKGKTREAGQPSRRYGIPPAQYGQGTHVPARVVCNGRVTVVFLHFPAKTLDLF